MPPIVRSRHPLWDQDDLHEGDEDDQRLVRALSQWPLKWRAALITSTGSAEPEEIFRVAGPSLWPFVTGIGVVIIFAAELIKLRWAAFVGLAVIAVGVIAWNWPQRSPTSETEEIAFEREHGIPVHVGGSLIIARWGMGLVLLFISIAYVTILLSYFYLRLDDQTWPPLGIEAPGHLLPVLAMGLTLGAALAIYSGTRSIRSGDEPAMRLRAGAGSVLGIAGVVALVTHLTGLGFDSQTLAYGSVYHLLGWFLVVVAAAACVMGVLVVVWTTREPYTSRRHVPMANLNWFWLTTAAIWASGVGVLVLAPVLT